ncbi:hypothetical protein [Peredibacter starrii]|uniref:Uncharacterized protein n=1 Tax=Peredibacter starrii TaxID=28202 RepID=A0AAX4HK47_9BACT|nr:hypothetical protein [Peredibacter starrii]WPU63596.1 hypothetical protein SOO65_12940 [Peredibacter starrii]
MIRLCILLLLVSCGKPITESGDAKKSENALKEGVIEGLYLDQGMFMNFDYLPLTGEIKDQKKHWSGDSWRLKFGSVNYRWNSPTHETRNYPSPHPRDLKRYSIDDLKQLSATEKYDLWLGRYDYFLKNLVENYLPEKPLDWEGLCHGWAGASINHNEPQPKMMMNPDGILIPFGSADIKALLTYYYSLETVPDSFQLGKRCESYRPVDDENCDNDVTPGEFHTVLANKLGLRGESFIMDIDRYLEVWNHPIISYNTHIMKDIRVKGSNRRVILRTALYYVDVALKSSWNPTIGTLSHLISKQQLDYELELTSGGNIVGGRWISRDRPDFMWTIKKVENFTGYLSGLNELIK